MSARRTGRAGLGAPRRGRPGGPGRKLPQRSGSAARSPRLVALAAELRDVAAGVGIRIRQERLMREVGYHTHSGLCRLGDAEILLLDHDLSAEQQVDLLLEILAGRDLGGIEASDEVRRLVAAASPARRAREHGSGS